VPASEYYHKPPRLAML